MVPRGIRSQGEVIISKLGKTMCLFKRKGVANCPEKTVGGTGKGWAGGSVTTGNSTLY